MSLYLTGTAGASSTTHRMHLTRVRTWNWRIPIDVYGDIPGQNLLVGVDQNNRAALIYDVDGGDHLGTRLYGCFEVHIEEGSR